MSPTKLEMRLEGDTQVVGKRFFAATPEQIYRAHTDPAIIQKWMLGPEGWHMPECQCDHFVGGKMKFVWANAEGHSFYATGEILEIDPPHRLVHVERMFLPDPTPDNHIVTTFEAVDGGCLMTLVMTLKCTEDRTNMLSSGMEDGMEISYARLETVI